MAVERVISTAKTTKRVGINTYSFNASDCAKRDPRLRNAGILYGHRYYRVEQKSRSHPICWCNTRQ